MPVSRQTQSLAWLLLLGSLAIAGIRTVRPRLFHTHAQIKQQEDLYLLPPPAQLKAMSLGYHAALADILWAHVLVAQGLHSHERRRFDNLLPLYDAIHALDPTWRSPYLLADALITFNSGHISYHEVLKAREILERGTEQRPYDAEIWLNLGQFVTYIAPSSYLEPDHPDVAARWRQEGPASLTRAAELSGDQSTIGWQTLGAVRYLQNNGQTEAAIRFLNRTHAITDDPELKANIEARLQALQVKRDVTQQLRQRKAFGALIQREVPFIHSQSRALLLGPPLDPARCAGPNHDQESACATSWRQWSERFNAQP